MVSSGSLRGQPRFASFSWQSVEANHNAHASLASTYDENQRCRQRPTRTRGWRRKRLGGWKNASTVDALKSALPWSSKKPVSIYLVLSLSQAPCHDTVFYVGGTKDVMLMNWIGEPNISFIFTIPSHGSLIQLFQRYKRVHDSYPDIIQRIFLYYFSVWIYIPPNEEKYRETGNIFKSALYSYPF